MSSKLTLYIEEDLIAYAKTYAKEQHLSVSKVVNNFFSALKQEVSEDKAAPFTQSLKGVLKQEEVDIAEYHKHLEVKYL